MTDKEIYTKAGISHALFYKLKRRDDFPHSDTDQVKINHCIAQKDNNKGRKPLKDKKPRTKAEAYNLSLQRAELDAALVHDKIIKNQIKVISTHHGKFTELVTEFVTGILEDIKACNLNKKQLNTLQDATGKRLKTLSAQLKHLRQD